MRTNSTWRIALVAAALATGAVALAQKESLLIGPGDVLHVVVFDTPELEQHARVTDAGDVTLLMGGSAHVASLTPTEAARKVEESLRNAEIMNHPAWRSRWKSMPPRRYPCLAM